MPQDSSLGPAFAQKGTRSWLICQPHGNKRHGPGQPKCHCTPLFTQLSVLPTVSPCTLCKGWEKVSWWGLVLDRKLRFYFSFVWYVPLLQAQFPIQTWLFSSQHDCSLPEGKEMFFKQFHSSNLHQWLPCSVVHYHHLGSLTFLMEYCAVWRIVSTVCVNPFFYNPFYLHCLCECFFYQKKNENKNN